jgi:hypothetical protein
LETREIHANGKGGAVRGKNGKPGGSTEQRPRLGKCSEFGQEKEKKDLDMIGTQWVYVRPPRQGY